MNKYRRRFPHRVVRALGALLLLAVNLYGGNPLPPDDSQKTNATDWVPLILKLPAPVFAGTPKAAPPDTTVETLPDKPGPPLKIPPDAHNIAPGKKISSSDKNTTRADLAKLTDGDKEADGDAILQLRKGLQWVQFDLGGNQEIYAIAIWHAHDTAKICRSVIVQLADDEDFTENVRTLFNNDRDNSAGLGAGVDRQYFETFRGKTIDAKGARARYVRLYSNGSTDNRLNEYTEVEIYGRPVK
jgi:hypothetical protein